MTKMTDKVESGCSGKWQCVSMLELTFHLVLKFSLEQATKA